MSKCREAYEKQYGEDFNPDHSPVASVWQAAWNAATKNAVEISDRFDFCGNEILIAEAIEAAYLREQLAELKKQEPVAWCFVQNGFTHYTDDKRDWYDAVGVEEVTPLYAAPVVQPDMVMVPRESTEAMIDAAMNRYKHVSPEAKARYTKMHRENFRCDYRAMIAVAEKEPQKVVQPDMVMVRKPRFWSKAESDAWHSALPDLHAAFDALAMAAEKE